MEAARCIASGNVPLWRPSPRAGLDVQTVIALLEELGCGEDGPHPPQEGEAGDYPVAEGACNAFASGLPLARNRESLAARMLNSAGMASACQDR